VYTASLTTPGEIRFRSKEILADGISDGVALGMFGLGEIEDEQPICTHFKEDVPVLLISKEVIIRGDLCVVEEPPDHGHTIEEGGDQGVGEQLGSKQQQLMRQESEPEPETLLTEINMRFPIPPRGHLSDITAVMHSLQERFKDISITLRARDGEISEEDFDEEVRDAFRRLRIELEEQR
jgi:hypothetical protein